MNLYLVNAGMQIYLIDPSDYGTWNFVLVVAETRGKARALFLNHTHDDLEWTSPLQIFKICQIDDTPQFIKHDKYWKYVSKETWDRLRDVSIGTPYLSPWYFA